MKLASQLHVVPGLRMNGAILLLPYNICPHGAQRDNFVFSFTTGAEDRIYWFRFLVIFLFLHDEPNNLRSSFYASENQCRNRQKSY